MKLIYYIEKYKKLNLWRRAMVEGSATEGPVLLILDIEVKSGRSGKTAGLSRFRQRYPEARALLVGGPGIPLEEFFSRDPRAWLAN